MYVRRSIPMSQNSLSRGACWVCVRPGFVEVSTESIPTMAPGVISKMRKAAKEMLWAVFLMLLLTPHVKGAATPTTDPTTTAETTQASTTTTEPVVTSTIQEQLASSTTQAPTQPPTTTAAPTTQTPTEAPTTTAAPSTQTPTEAPTTEAPTTTAAPTTNASIIVAATSNQTTTTRKPTPAYQVSHTCLMTAAEDTKIASTINKHFPDYNKLFTDQRRVEATSVVLTMVDMYTYERGITAEHPRRFSNPAGVANRLVEVIGARRFMLRKSTGVPMEKYLDEDEDENLVNMFLNVWTKSYEETFGTSRNFYDDLDAILFPIKKQRVQFKLNVPFDPVLGSTSSIEFVNYMARGCTSLREKVEATNQGIILEENCMLRRATPGSTILEYNVVTNITVDGADPVTDVVKGIEGEKTFLNEPVEDTAIVLTNKDYLRGLETDATDEADIRYTDTELFMTVTLPACVGLVVAIFICLCLVRADGCLCRICGDGGKQKLNNDD